MTTLKNLLTEFPDLSNRFTLIGPNQSVNKLENEAEIKFEHKLTFDGDDSFAMRNFTYELDKFLSAQHQISFIISVDCPSHILLQLLKNLSAFSRLVVMNNQEITLQQLDLYSTIHMNNLVVQVL